MRVDCARDISAALAAAAEQGKLLLLESDFGPDFFDLRTGLAGELFQKFVNYRMPLAIVVPDPAARGERFAELAREHRSHPTIRILASTADAEVWLDTVKHSPLKPSRAVVVSLATALAGGEPPPGNLAVPIFAHGTLEAELYTPRGGDRQRPHSRDEVYVVAGGEAVFFDGTYRHSVGRGSFVFVPAGQEHRFEDFTPDFAVWVLFYGPEGGEAGS